MMNLVDIFNNHNGYSTDKWEQYLYIYNLEFANIVNRNKPVDLLEVGVANGGSLELWKKFLPENSNIYGMDINPECKNIEYQEPIKCFIGDARKKEDLESFFPEQKFDIIIDDGSHICPDVIADFENLFPMLKNGGIYIIEDVHASYWKYWKGGFKRKNTTIEYFKNFADAVNCDHVLKNPPAFFNKKEKNLLLELNKHVASVTFYDSVIVVKKFVKEKTSPFRNIVTGEIYPVAEFPFSDEVKMPVKKENNLFSELN